MRLEQRRPVRVLDVPGVRRQLRTGMAQPMRALVLVMLVACSGSGSGDDDGGGGDGGVMIDAPTMAIDSPTQTFPAVCQELPLSCPDAASLATCEAGSAAAFGACSYLPITAGCATAGCPSDAQICRTAESSAGHCTHSCVNDADCVVAGGGSATCRTINGVVKVCTVD